MESNSPVNPIDINSTHDIYIEDDHFNEDIDEANYCEEVSQHLEPYNNKNILPFNSYLKPHISILYQGLVELERVRPKNPVEFYCAYILEKNEPSKDK